MGSGVSGVFFPKDKSLFFFIGFGVLGVSNSGKMFVPLIGLPSYTKAKKNSNKDSSKTSTIITPINPMKTRTTTTGGVTGLEVGKERQPLMEKRPIKSYAALLAY